MPRGKLTANQQLIIRCAVKAKGDWVCSAGQCNMGGFGGRGFHFSFPKLVKLGLIETTRGLAWKFGRDNMAAIKYRAIRCGECGELVAGGCTCER